MRMVLNLYSWARVFQHRAPLGGGRIRGTIEGRSIDKKFLVNMRLVRLAGFRKALRPGKDPQSTP